MLPQLRELEREFADELVVIGVHAGKFPAERVPANLRAAVQRLGLHHPVVDDAGFALWDQYAVRAWPTLMFVDPRGRVFGKHEGEFPLGPVRDLLREAVARFDAEGALDRTPLPLDPLPPGGATLRFPEGILADAEGGRLFVADTGHHRVLVADLDGRVRQVVGAGAAGFADGGPGEARFDHPRGLALAPDGAALWVADTGNHALRRVDLASGAVTTVAGTGERGRARSGRGAGRETALASPWDVAFVGERLWVAMAGTHQLWELDPATGEAGPVAGTGAEALHDGPLAEATFAQPSGLAALDGAVYVADSEASAVRRVDLALGRVRRLVGRGLFDFGDEDGTEGQARVRLQHPLGIAATREGGAPAVYLADTYNHKLKRLDPAARTVTTLAGDSAASGHEDGDPDAARFWEPGGVSLAGRTLWVADTNNHAVRAIDLDRGRVRTVELVDV